MPVRTGRLPSPSQWGGVGGGAFSLDPTYESEGLGVRAYLLLGTCRQQLGELGVHLVERRLRGLLAGDSEVDVLRQQSSKLVRLRWGRDWRGVRVLVEGVVE